MCAGSGGGGGGGACQHKHTQRVKNVKTIISHQKNMSHRLRQQKRFVVYCYSDLVLFLFSLFFRLQTIGWCDVRLSRSDLSDSSLCFLLLFFLSLSRFFPNDWTGLDYFMCCYALLPKVSFDT